MACSRSSSHGLAQGRKMTFWRPILRLEGERSGSSDVEEQAIVLTFGGVDVVAQPYLLATSTQASLLGGVGVEQVIEEEGTVLHGRREEGTETCDYLCDELVAIVARLDPHKPANTDQHGALSLAGMLLPR